MNLLQGPVTRSERALVCRLGEQTVALPEARQSSLRPYEGKPIVVGIRPEALREPTDGDSGDAELRGELTTVELLGHERLLMLDIGVASAVSASTGLPISPSDSDATESEVEPSVLRARVPGMAAAQVGSMARLRFDPASLHFFDPTSGVSVA
jgi:multiple sugar transport system ATP-binding protein